MCSYLIFTPTFRHKSYYPHLYDEQTEAWRVLGNFPKVTVLLSRKLKIQTLPSVCIPQISAPSAFLCHLPKMNREFPESSQPGGHEIPKLKQASGDREPIPT